MRVKTTMKKLTEPDTNFVSLVRRSANQMPFRIKKEAEENMNIDLSSPSRLLSGTRKSKTAKVGALIVRKSADMEKVKEIVRKAGFTTDKMTEKADGSVVFAQSDKPEEGSAVRMSENLVLVMKDYSPWSADITTFNDRLGADGYYEGLCAGTSALRSLLIDIVWKSETHEDMSASAEKALDDFKTWALALMKSIPVAAYRLDEDFAKVSKDAGEATTTIPASGPTPSGKIVSIADALAPIARAEDIGKPETHHTEAPSSLSAGGPASPNLEQKQAPNHAAEAVQENPMNAALKESLAAKAATLPSADTGAGDNLSANATAAQAVAGDTGPAADAAGTATNAATGVPAAGPGKTVPVAGTGAGLPDSAGLTVQKMQEMLNGITETFTKAVKGLEDKVAGLEASTKTAVQKSAEVEEKMKSTVAAAPPMETIPPAGKESTQKAADMDKLERYDNYDSAFHGKL